VESLDFSFQTVISLSIHISFGRGSCVLPTLTAHWTSFLRVLLPDPGKDAMHMKGMVAFSHHCLLVSGLASDMVASVQNTYIADSLRQGSGTANRYCRMDSYRCHRRRPRACPSARRRRHAIP
jgi:hypothetical protein